MFITKMEEYIEFTDNDLMLTRNTPQLPYRSRRGEKKTIFHWGQRKLLLSEILFFIQTMSNNNKKKLCASFIPKKKN